LAAKRLVEYWEKRLELFGPEKAFLPLHLDKALREDTYPMSLEYIRLLPVKADPSGRSVIIVDPSKQEGSKYARESMVRVVWYMIHAALEDEETQKKGIVVIANPKNAKFSQFDQKQDSMIVASLKGILPMRLSEIHICNPPYFFRILFPIVKIFLGERLRKRVNVHSGSDEKMLDRLDKFGLKREDLPSDLGGQIVLDHDGWLEDRKHDGK
jgi:hypothetical protein